MSDEETTPDVETTDDVETTEDVETTPDVEATEGAEIDEAAASDTATTEAEVTPSATSRWRSLPVVPLALVLGLIAAGSLAGWVYFSQYRPDEMVDHSVEQSVVSAARDGTTALLTYKPETLNEDFAAAKSHLSGDFANYYDKFTKDVIAPAAQSKGVKTTAQVVGAAAKDLHPDSAVVLIFVNQATVSKERPDPSMASSAVLVTMNKLHGDWLITKFDPI